MDLFLRKSDPTKLPNNKLNAKQSLMQLETNRSMYFFTANVPRLYSGIKKILKPLEESKPGPFNQ